MELENSQILLTALEIDKIINNISIKISKWLKIININEVEFIILLQGAKPFADALYENLKRQNPHLSINNRYLKLSATSGTELKEEVEFIAGDINNLPLNSPIIIIDELVDSAKTVNYIFNQISQKLNINSNIASNKDTYLKKAILINKYESPKTSIDFLGYDLKLDKAELSQKGIKDIWLYGFGMDISEKYRELENIYGYYVK